MSAAVLLATLHGIGAEVAADGSELVVNAPADRLAPELVMELRDRKPQVIALLNGETCIHCEGPIDWRRPTCVAFGDGTGAHLACYEEAELARLLAAGKRAAASPEALADPAELTLAGRAAVSAVTARNDPMNLQPVDA